MIFTPRKQSIPWLMAAARVTLAPVLVLGETFRWNGIVLAAMVLTALLSDIFDGVLARRWYCDTPAVRLFDSMADTVFYLGVAVALWIGRPQLLHAHWRLLAALLSLEAFRIGFDLLKFGKPASYHSNFAKAWGLVLSASVIAAFVTSHTGMLLSVALAMGVACNLESFMMSLLLPSWHNDIKSLRCALKIRKMPEQSRSNGGVKALIAVGVAAMFCFCLAVPALAATADDVIYLSGSAQGLSAEMVGALDLQSPLNLVFHLATGNQSFAIHYADIRDFQYKREVTHHLGVLPAIAAGLFAARQHRHYFTVNYVDANNIPQVAVFEVPAAMPRVLLPVLRACTSVCH